MVAPVDRPRGVLAGTFGVGILTFLLLPSEVGYQDLAALIARDVASVERPQKTSLASPFGTIHAANLNLPQPVGSGIKPSPLGYTLAALDPGNTEITGSIREQILRESALLYAPPEGAGPWVDRSRKGDQLTSPPRGNDNVAAKGDRSLHRLCSRQRQGPSRQSRRPRSRWRLRHLSMQSPRCRHPLDIEAEHVVAAEKQLADAAEEAAQMQLAALPASRDAEPTQPQAEKSAPTRRAQSTKRSQRSARAEREEQRRAERIARDARQKAEKLARSQDAPKSSVKRPRTVDAKPRSETAEYARPVSPAQSERIRRHNPRRKPSRSRQPPPRDLCWPAPAITGSGSKPGSSTLDRACRCDGLAGETGNNVEPKSPRARRPRSTPRSRPRRPKGPVATHVEVVLRRRPDGQEGRRNRTLDAGYGAEVGWPRNGRRRHRHRATKDVGVKLAALPPVESATDTRPCCSHRRPNARSCRQQSRSERQQGSEPAGWPEHRAQRRGDWRRPAADDAGGTPRAQRREGRAKTVKCLTEVIYFEARGEVVRGQMAVAQVVLNRAFSGKYPNTVCGVVYQNAHRHLACQFTFACDGIADKVNEPDMWERAQRDRQRDARRQDLAAGGRQGDALPCALGSPRLGARDEQAAPGRRAHLLPSAQLGRRHQRAAMGRRRARPRKWRRNSSKWPRSRRQRSRRQGPHSVRCHESVDMAGLVPAIDFLTRPEPAHISISRPTSKLGAEWVIQPDEA